MIERQPVAAVILAAGKGTRMRSATHKVLHPVAGRPMLLHLLDTLSALSPERTVVVTGAGREQVEAAVVPLGVAVATQEPQLGTAHAVLQAEAALAGFAGDVLVLYGDVPMVGADTMRALVDRLHGADDPAVVVLTFRPADPLAYGRVRVDGGGRIHHMVEYKDADAAERAWPDCNSGLMAVRAADLWPLLKRVGNMNAGGEYYLPDVAMLAIGDGRAVAAIAAEPWEVAGINSRAELAAVEADWQRRRRARAMDEGASLADPDTVWFAHDTTVGRDVTIGQNVVFGPGVTIGDGAAIRPFSHVEGATVAAAEIGPFARLRPGAEIGDGAKVGNFVEVKKTRLGRGAKVNHLSYVGDAEVGAGANLGAGTITCNYDGFLKYRTVIGAGAFIGSNSALVAPVAIGAGAIVGAGSVVTADVEADALALARGRQEVRPGWAKRFRVLMAGKKRS